jgi:hypothetical protein
MHNKSRKLPLYPIVYVMNRLIFVMSQRKDLNRAELSANPCMFEIFHIGELKQFLNKFISRL